MQFRVIAVEGKHFPKDSTLCFTLGEVAQKTQPLPSKSPKWNAPFVFPVQDAENEVLHVSILEKGKEEFAALDIPLNKFPSEPQCFKLNPVEKGKNDPRVVLYFQMPFEESQGQVAVVFEEKKHHHRHIEASATSSHTQETYFVKVNPDGTSESMAQISSDVSALHFKYDSSDLSSSSSSSSSSSKKSKDRKIFQKVKESLLPELPNGEVYPSSRTVIDELAQEETEENVEKEIPDLSDWSSDDEKVGSLSDWSSNDEKVGSLSDGSYKEVETTTTVIRYKQARLLEELNLNVRIVEAEKLPITDANGSTDGYCVLRYNGKEMKTKVQENTLDPKWNEEFVIDAGGALESFLEVKLFDKDPLKDDALGKIEVPIKSMTVGKVSDEWFPLIPIIKLPEPLEIKTRIHVVYQLSEKGKTPFEDIIWNFQQ